MLHTAVCVLLSCSLTVADGASRTTSRTPTVAVRESRPDSQPSLSPFDYARVVRMSFPWLPESEKIRYYDRVTGQRLENLPVLPYPTGPLAGGWYCPAGTNQGRAGKIGFIDRLGNWVIPPQFTWTDSFKEGRAPVGVGKQVGVIDRAGRWVVKPGRYDKIFPYMEGRASFRQKGKWGFLGLDGEVAIPARYGMVRSFSHGAAIVQDEKGWHCIDREGKTRFRLAGQPLGWCFSDGLLLVDEEAVLGRRVLFGEDTTVSGCGYMSLDGKIAIPLGFDCAEGFSEGLAVVGMSRDDTEAWPAYRYGAIDVKGRLVVPLGYDQLSLFRDGLAAFRRVGKWGYLDRHGKEVIPARFQRARPFFDGLAEVAIGGKVAVIDISGRVVIRTDVEWVEF